MIFEHEGKTQRRAVAEDLTIGGSEDADLRLPEAYPRRCALIVRRTYGFMLYNVCDEGEVMWVGEELVTDRMPIESGDVISIYDVTMTFEVTQ